MPVLTPQQLAEIARSRKRDGHGHFLPKELPSPHPSRTEKGEEPIIEFRANNPLNPIIKLLQEIKAHQATKVSFQATIPIIALPVALWLVFNLGRAQAACVQTFTSKEGIIKNLSVLAPKDKETPFSLLFSFFPAIPKPDQFTKLVNEERSILRVSQEETITIIHDSQINLISFENQRVILTGTFSACTHTITLDSLENLTPVY